MNITKEKIGPCRWKIVVEVPAEMVAEEHERRVRAVMEIAVVNGFRPGRAPRTLVENKYAKTILEDVKDVIVQKGYRAAVEQENLKIVHILNIEDPTVLIGQAASFSMVVDAEPDFVLPDYKSIPVKSLSLDVSDEEVARVKKNILAELERWRPVENRPAIAGNMVVVDYEGFYEGKPLSERKLAFSLVAAAKDMPILTDETPWLPGMGKALIGANAGERKEVFIEFPQNYQDPELAGKRCAYFVQVKEIREKYVEQPDEKFYSRFGVKNDSELEQRIREGIQQTKERENKARQKAQIYEHLLKQLDMELPQSEVEDAVRNEVREQLARIRAPGDGTEISEEMRRELVAMSSSIGTDRVKLRYILNKVADIEGISPEPREVQAAVAALVQAEGGGAHDAEAMLKNEAVLENVKKWLRRQKAADWLLSHAKVEPVEGGSKA